MLLPATSNARAGVLLYLPRRAPSMLWAAAAHCYEHPVVLDGMHKIISRFSGEREGESSKLRRTCLRRTALCLGWLQRARHAASDFRRTRARCARQTQLDAVQALSANS